MIEFEDVVKLLNDEGTIAVSINHTVIAEDKNINVTTGASDKTISLPVLASSKGREITISKADSGAGDVVIDGDGSETINGNLTDTISSQFSVKTYVGFPTEWRIK